MEIDIKQYLSEEAIKEIVRESVSLEISYRVKNSGLDRMIDNMAYNILISVVSEQAYGASKFKASLLDKMEKAVTDNMAFYAFYEGRHLDKLMKDTIQDNRAKLQKHMVDTFMSRSYDEEILDKMQKESEDIMGNMYNLIGLLSTKNK